MAEITRLRGGTLAWGVPVTPLTEPIVLVVDSGSAWDAVRGRDPVAEPGLGWIGGVRPSGEAY